MSTVRFDSAYNYLTPVERGYADRAIAHLCAAAAREGVRPLDMASRDFDARLAGPDGPAVLSRPLVRSAVCDQLRAAGSVGAVTYDGMFSELFQIIHSNIDDILQRDQGSWLEFKWHDLTREQLSAFESITMEEFPDGKRKLKATYWNKLKAIELADKMKQQMKIDNPLRAIDTTLKGQWPTLPKQITDAQAADEYGRLLVDMGG